MLIDCCSTDLINFVENGLHLVLEVTDKRDVRLLHFSAQPFREEDAPVAQRGLFRLVELQATGENQDDHHGARHTGTSPGRRLVYVAHCDKRNEQGRKLEIEQRADGLRVISHLQFFDGIAMVRAWTEVINDSAEAVGLEYVSSFALCGVTKEGLLPWHEKTGLHVAHNTWYGESQWRAHNLPELGLYPCIHTPVKRIAYSVTGTWPAEGFLPMGMVENAESGAMLFWQIEAPGSWLWEMALRQNHLCLNISGPTENEHHWWKNLAPGESFDSVPVAIGSVAGDFERAVGELTRYRRAIRRPNADNVNLPVIFNDYMNCLMGDPTTEKLLPLIDAAAEAGSEYFCIDCGWYDDGDWWQTVGEWLPSTQRFPGGIKEPLDYIRKKGMIPGLWLEIEVVGIDCPMVERVPKEWFFQRHGKPIIDHGRYQLDFRNPEVVAHADAVLDRLVREYGVGYIKMDYNINGGTGTERDAGSFGDGLLEHNRAYLRWLDGIFARYPELVIENCGSGGLRASYAFLSRHSIHSSSDQMDYRRYAAIAAASPSAMTPEQCAVWSYPLRDGDREEVIFNMVNAMLLRIHQSGHLAEISAERRELVTEAIACYKRIRADIPAALPFWPLGVPQMGDGWLCYGLHNGDKRYLAIWRLDSADATCALPLGDLRGQTPEIRVAYPQNAETALRWNAELGILSVTLPQLYCGRLIEIC